MTQQEIIKALIHNSGLNKKQFAEKHKLNKSYMSKVIKGNAEYRHATLGLIAFDEGFDLKLTYTLEKL